MTPTQFLQVVKQSRLIDSGRLAKVVEELNASGKPIADAQQLSKILIDRNLLTDWQAEKLLQGRHKGFILGKYKLQALLGKGGMSSVYLAEHVLMRRQCAIKVLPSKRVNDASYLGRFHREAQAIASLDHPNIVRAFDIDHEMDGDQEIHFLVMEYIDGQDLQQMVGDKGPLGFITIAEYTRQAAEGLEHAHDVGMVHRDIKPGNLLIDQSGTVKLLDMGLARFFDDPDEHSLTVAHDEKVLGTADYLSPEQAVDSHKVDARADLYSLGCTMYFALTGHPPFSEGTLAQRLIAHQTKEPPSITKDRPDIPPSLLAIIEKMMSKKRDARYQTAREIAEVMSEWLMEHGGEEWRAAHPRLSGILRGSDPNLHKRQQAEAAKSPPAAAKKQPPSGTRRPSPPGGKPQAARPAPKSNKSPAGGQPKSTPARPSGAAAEKQPAKPVTPSPASTQKPQQEPVLDLGLDDDPVATEMASRPVIDDEPKTGEDASDTQPSFLIDTEPVGRSGAQPRHPGSSVTPIRRRKKSFWSHPATIIAIIVLLLGGATTAILIAVLGSKNKKAPAAKTDGVKRETGPSVKDGKLTVGPDADFETINDALAFAKKEYQPGKGNLQILVAGGKTYNERIELGPWASGVELIGDNAPVLDPEGNEPVLSLNNASGVRVSGFTIVTDSRPVAVLATDFCSETVVEKLTLTGVGQTGIDARKASGVNFAPLQLLDITFQMKEIATGIQLGESNAYIDIVGGRFIAAKKATGIEIDAGTKLNNVRVANCSFVNLDTGIGLSGLPERTSTNFRIARNLFFDTRQEVVLKSGSGAIAGLKPEEAERNWTNGKNPVPPKINVFQKDGKVEAKVRFASTEPGNADFLRPSGMPKFAGSATEPERKHIGALAPK